MSPIPVKNLGGKRFCLIMISAPHHYVRNDSLRTRAVAAATIHDFIAWMDRNAKHCTKWVHCDISQEFIALRIRLKKLRTELTTSSPYTPESNRLPEMTNRSMMDKALFIMTHEGLSDQYWDEAIWKAARIHNRIISSSSNMKSTHQISFGKHRIIQWKSVQV